MASSARTAAKPSKESTGHTSAAKKATAVATKKESKDAEAVTGIEVKAESDVPKNVDKAVPNGKTKVETNGDKLSASKAETKADKLSAAKAETKADKADAKTETKAETKADKVETKADKPSAAKASARGKTTKKSATGAVKRGPGRPPKKTPTPPLEIKGIADAPEDPENRYELIASKPEQLKKLFNFCKNIKADVVEVFFRKTETVFLAKDHEQRNFNIAYLLGSDAVHYYCESPFKKRWKRDMVEKVFSRINKSYFKMSITAKREDDEKFDIAMLNAEIGRQVNYKIESIGGDFDPELETAEQEVKQIDETAAQDNGEDEKKSSSFPIRFTLTNKELKQEITDALVKCEVITIEKAGEYPLMFASSDGSYRSTYTEEGKIDLVSTIRPKQSFSCELRLANIKSFASSMVAEKVRIYCRETGEKIMLKSVMDDRSDDKADTQRTKSDGDIMLYTLVKVS